MKKNYKSMLILVILCSLLFIYLIYTDFVVENILEYTDLFITKLFPVSFIFFTLSNLLIDYNFMQVIQRIFKINSPYLYILILSLISGFPSGAVYTKEMLEKDLIDVCDANKIIMFSHFPNPLFVLNSVGLILGDQIITYKVLAALILSNLIILLFCHHKSGKIIATVKFPYDFSHSLVGCIMKSFRVLIIIYGTGVFFFLIAAILTRHINNIYLYVIINGIFDLTKGVYSTLLINNTFIRAILIIMFISFGPLAIQLQIKSILADTDIKYKSFIKGRFFGMLLSILIFVFLSIL